MKLLFDENLSPALVVALAGLFQGAAHVRDVGLKSSSDRKVWDYAAEMGYIIVTKDADFRQRSFLWPTAQGNLHWTGELLDEANRGAYSQRKRGD